MQTQTVSVPVPLPTVTPTPSHHRSIFDPLPDNAVIRLRPSEIVQSSICMKAVGYARAGIRSQVDNANLAFGTCGHKALEHYMLGDLKPHELPPFFEAQWTKAKREKSISYSKTIDWSTLNQIGKRLLELFPEWWKTVGIKPVLIEQRMEVQIAENVILSLCPDLIGEVQAPLYDHHGFQLAQPGDIVVLDWKFPTAGSEAKPGFARKAKQPTYYKIGYDAHAPGLGLPSAAAVGFVDLVKKPIPKTSRGRGPWIEDPFLYPRTDAQVREALRFAVWVADQIRAGNYFESPQLAFNSPCEGMVSCDYLDLCSTGVDTTGLEVPAHLSSEMLCPSEV